MHIIAWLSPHYIIRNRVKWDDYSRIDELISFGAKEFFVWYVPPYWYENLWFELSPNGRQSALSQIQSKQHLQDLVNYIHSKWLEIMVTLNANSFNASIWDKIKQMIQDIIDVNADWVIVSDLWVLEYLKEIGFQKKINASTIFCIYNSETVRFLSENYKISRFILPRELTIKEIQEITSEFPDLKFEAFLSWDKCVWNNGFCFTEHNTKWNPHSYCQFLEKIYTYKKRVEYWYKDVITNLNISLDEKLRLMDNEPEGNLWNVAKDLLSSEYDIDTLFSIYRKFKDKSNIIYDITISDKQAYNQNVISFVRWVELNLINIEYSTLDEWQKEKYNTLNEFIKNKKFEIKSWKESYEKEIKEKWIKFIQQIDTIEWNRSGMDVLDYFKEIPNLEALKVASRGKDLQAIVEYITWITDKDFMLKWFIPDHNQTGKFSYYKHPTNKTI